MQYEFHCHAQVSILPWLNQTHEYHQNNDALGVGCTSLVDKIAE
jgi:hypothetical protein